MIILQSDAKRIITDYFKVWAAERVSGRTATGSDGVLFFAHLQAEKRQLLEFRHPSTDKLQVVQSWLSGAGLVSDS
jgi:hypothetical protein